MSYIVGIILLATMVLPSLFGQFAPLVYITFIFFVLTRRDGININGKILLGFFLFMVLGILLIIWNVYIFGDYSPWTFWIAGFLTWFFFIHLLRSIPSPELFIHKSLVATGYVVAITNLVYIAAFLAGISVEPISVPGFTAFYGMDAEGRFAYSSSLLPHICYLFPYFIYAAARNNDKRVKNEKTLTWLLAVAGLLSLRSIIFLSIAISFLYYVWVKFHSWKFVSVLLIVGACLTVLYFNFLDTFDFIYQLKWADKISGDDVRYNQLMFWLRSFADSPLIGHGLSSVQMEVFNMATGELIQSRSGPIVSPYGYEIFYGKMLSDIGMIFFIYCAIFYYLTFSVKTFNSLNWQVGALRFAAIFMLVQSGTNSYLGTSGWLFVLMLPMIFISNRSQT